MFGNNNNLSRYDDDDDSFVPHTTSTTNLANMFTAFTLDNNAATTLKYAPPKEPTKHHVTADTAKRKLTCVKTVSLSRYFKETGFSCIGRYGIAVIASDADADAHLLLYKTKTSILSTSRLSSTFKCTLINDVTLQFTDDNAECWRVAFDNSHQQLDVLAELNKHAVNVAAVADDEAHSTDMPPPDVVTSSPVPKEEQARADILERISKVGRRIAPSQPILPVLPSSPPPPQLQLADTCESVRTRHSDEFDDTVGMNVVSKSGTYITTTCNPLMDPLGIYFAENRTHNSEVRMNLATLGSKIDSLLRLNTPTLSVANEIALEKRISELEQRLQLHGNADNAQEGVLQQQIADTQKELAAKEAECDVLQTKNGELIDKVAQLQLVVNEQQMRLDAQEKRAEMLESEHFLEVKHLQSVCDELSEQHSRLLQERAQEETLLTNVAKNAMNALYEKIMRVYAQQPQCLTVIKELKKTHQEHMRVTTFQIIHDFVQERNKFQAGDVATIGGSIEVSPEFEVTV